MDLKRVLGVIGYYLYVLSFVYVILLPTAHGTDLQSVLSEVYGGYSGDWVYWVMILAVLLPLTMIKLNLKRSIGYVMLEAVIFITIVMPVIYTLNWKS